jgi:cytochrome c-type biogenesis protein CcmE
VVREGAPEETLPFPPEDEEERGGRFNKRLLIGAAVVILATAYLMFLSLDAASAVYMDVDQVVAAGDLGDRRVRVGGTVTPGSIQYGEDGLDIRFVVNGTEASMPVEYRGVPPDIFGDNATVFVEGYYAADGVFRADILLTRHPDTMEALPEGFSAPDYQPTY